MVSNNTLDGEWTHRTLSRPLLLSTTLLNTFNLSIVPNLAHTPFPSSSLNALSFPFRVGCRLGLGGTSSGSGIDGGGTSARHGSWVIDRSAMVVVDGGSRSRQHEEEEG